MTAIILFCIVIIASLWLLIIFANSAQKKCPNCDRHLDSETKECPVGCEYRDDVNY